jgi:hypothetical protein
MAVLTFYDKYKESLIDSTYTPVNFSSDTIKIGLCTSSYTPGASDTMWSTPASFEVSGTNYSAGGATTTATVTGTGTATITVKLSNITWSQSVSGFSNALTMVLYKSTGTSSTSPLIAYYNFGSAVGNVSGDLTITFDGTLGAFTLS